MRLRTHQRAENLSARPYNEKLRAVPHDSRVSVRPMHDDQRGQASVELVAAIPVALVAALAAWQLALLGQAAWLSAHAARAAARG